jgi:hypothetical protein
MIDEFKKICKEAVVAYYLDIYLEEVKKTTHNFSQNIRYLSPKTNQVRYPLTSARTTDSVLKSPQNK